MSNMTRFNKKSAKGKPLAVKKIGKEDVVVMEDGTEAKVVGIERFEREIKRTAKGAILEVEVSSGPYAGARMTYAYLDDDKIDVSKQKTEPSSFAKWWRSLWDRPKALSITLVDHPPTWSDKSLVKESAIKEGATK